MAKFENRRQRYDGSIDNFMADLELLRKRSNPDKKVSERNPGIVTKLMKGVENDKVKIMQVTHFILSADSMPTQDDLRINLCEYLQIKPTAQNRYQKL